MVPSGQVTSLAERLAALPPPLPERLRLVAVAAEQRAWLVGGSVRDLLLGRDLGDVDVVVERDPCELLRGLPVRLLKTTTFGTATVAWADGSTWDIVRARGERYPMPAALPVTWPADLATDLARRDFGINAIACGVGETSWGALVDTTGGLEDLARRQVRALHPESFRDDPTRLFRALRFAARLGFALEVPTARLLRAAVRAGLVDALSHDRLRHELEHSLGEPGGD
ncbi:MAG: CCA tRNA nucleotidyltransferase, partial [Armatimonadetes bacterium]|nr:CCA tRNA nucleotidyltransferase [Armatimonadota bacterium]